jgi:FdhD protein
MAQTKGTLGAEALVLAPRTAHRQGGVEAGVRPLAEEQAVALVHDGSTTAVMMATPADLEDFGVGFSLTEGIVGRAEELRGLEVAHSSLGTEVRMWLEPERSARLLARRRRIAGPTGCGLCGIDSLAEAVRPPARVAKGSSMTAAEILAAVATLAGRQPLGSATRAVHAAALWTREAGLAVVREDVGRHNALDKLAGALARSGRDAGGAVILTSRVSVEMVQKAAAIGAPIVVAVSAPTALAVRTAEAAGLTLVAIARADGFEVFAGHERVTG